VNLNLQENNPHWNLYMNTCGKRHRRHEKTIDKSIACETASA